jgi:hypothetical protein
VHHSPQAVTPLSGLCQTPTTLPALNAGLGLLLRARLNWLLSHRRLWDTGWRCLLTCSLWLHCRLGCQCSRFDVVRKDVPKLRNRNESDPLLVVLVGEKVETGFSCFEGFALDSGSIVTNCFHGGQQVN